MSSTAPVARRHGAALFLAVASFVMLVLALLSPDLTVGPGAMEGMSMTHYMGLLSIRQPWNLLLFMAAPVILAEILAITEMVMLLNPAAPTWVRSLSHWAGLLAGPLWVFIFVHLFAHAVMPLTYGGGWRGAADVIAVLSYLVGAVPMMGISLIEAGLLGHDDAARKRLHVTFVAIFLVVAHVAMIFGMLDPTVMGWSQQAAGAPGMAGHNHGGAGRPMATPTASR